MCPEDCPDTCELPPVTGRCKAAFRRWFHNSISGQCEQFIYGGCGGNENNFMTLEECQQQCSPQPGTELLKYTIHYVHVHNIIMYHLMQCLRVILLFSVQYYIH